MWIKYRATKMIKEMKALTYEVGFNGYKELYTGNSLRVWWLGLRVFTPKGTGSIPGWGTKIPKAPQCGQKIILIKELYTLITMCACMHAQLCLTP